MSRTYVCIQDGFTSGLQKRRALYLVYPRCSRLNEIQTGWWILTAVPSLNERTSPGHNQSRRIVTWALTTSKVPVRNLDRSFRENGSEWRIERAIVRLMTRFEFRRNYMRHGGVIPRVGGQTSYISVLRRNGRSAQTSNCYLTNVCRKALCRTNARFTRILEKANVSDCTRF